MFGITFKSKGLPFALFLGTVTSFASTEALRASAKGYKSHHQSRWDLVIADLTITRTALFRILWHPKVFSWASRFDFCVCFAMVFNKRCYFLSHSEGEPQRFFSRVWQRWFICLDFWLVCCVFKACLTPLNPSCVCDHSFADHLTEIYPDLVLTESVVCPITLFRNDTLIIGILLSLSNK